MENTITISVRIPNVLDFPIRNMEHYLSFHSTGRISELQAAQNNILFQQFSQSITPQTAVMLITKVKHIISKEFTINFWKYKGRFLSQIAAYV